jgi:hypothetical protein
MIEDIQYVNSEMQKNLKELDDDTVRKENSNNECEISLSSD